MFKKILIGIVVCGIMVFADFTYGGSKSVSNKIITKEKAEKSNKLKPKNLLLIKIEITQGKDKIASPKVIVSNGKEAKIRMVKEVYFPLSWEAPVFAKLDSKNIKVVSPVPVFGKPTEIGLSIFITPKIVKHPGKGEIIFVCGRISITKNSKFKKITYPGFKYKGMQHSINPNITSFMLYFVDTNEQEISFKCGDSLYKVKIHCSKLTK